MTNESNSPKWWQTLTGMLTATTAIITAITGLLVALHQTGMFNKTPSPVPAEASVSRSVASKEEPSAAPATNAVDSHLSNTQLANSSSNLKLGERLSGQQVVRLGNFIYTLERAELVEYNAENFALRVKLRMQNNEKFPVNFWNQNFRLLVDSVPRAPSGDLNLLVEGGSALDGELEFLVPKQSNLLSLRILDGDDKTEVKL